LHTLDDDDDGDDGGGGDDDDDDECMDSRNLGGFPARLHSSTGVHG